MLSSDTKGAVADELHNAPFLVAACATPPAKCRSELMIYPVRICTINWILGAQRCINSSSHRAVYAAVHLLSLTTVCISVCMCMRFSVCALTCSERPYACAALGPLPMPHCLNLKCSLNLLNINLCGVHLCTQCMQCNDVISKSDCEHRRGSLSLLCAVFLGCIIVSCSVCIGR
jgi:hypothetical protein